MKEHPILFSGEMVRAILEGRKTQTRRVMRPQPYKEFGCFNWVKKYLYLMGFSDEQGFWTRVIEECPYGQPGDRLWVRETWSKSEPCVLGSKEQPTIWYKANNNRPTWAETIWRPSIHMPRWASRITLEVTGVRVERVQDISEEDAIAEGMEQKEPNHVVSARYCFGQLWNSINAKRGYGWDVNPWVWVVEFKRV